MSTEVNAEFAEKNVCGSIYEFRLNTGLALV